LLAQANTQATAPIPTSGSLGSGIPVGDFIAPISTAGGSIGAILEYADAASARATAFADLLDMQNAQDLRDLIAYQSSVGDLGGYSPYMNRGGSGGFGGGSGGTNITVNTGIGDPEAIARAIEDAIRQANQRGTTSLSIA
jgi:hypothetical protein